MQHEIKTRTPLLLSDGSLGAKGYARKMNVVYNRERARGFPLKLKEWNFYQFIKHLNFLIVTDNFFYVFLNLHSFKHNLSAALNTFYTEIRTDTQNGKLITAARVLFLHKQSIAQPYIHKNLSVSIFYINKLYHKQKRMYTTIL